MEKNQNNIEKFEPVISASSNIAEITWKAIILGAIISVLFGVANAYLGLKFGMTVSASIPAAVISMAVLRLFFGRKVTVLENNMVQTIGSAGESLAAGIIFTIPAFFIWGASSHILASGELLGITENETFWLSIVGGSFGINGMSVKVSSTDFFSISQTQIFWLSMLGGSLGILLMIPLRKYLVDREHGKLRFPEGTACAEIIVAGDEGGGKAKLVFTGIGIGVMYKFLMDMCRGWAEKVNYDFQGILKGGTFGIAATPALLGVGYIIGPRIAALMLSGAVLGYLGIGPLLAYIGQQIPDAIIAPATTPLSTLSTGDLRTFYITYIGVGAVAVGGFVSLIKSFPIIISSFSKGFSELIGKKKDSEQIPRTDKDLPMKWVLLGVSAVILAIWALPGTKLELLGAAIAVLFGFFFVVVAARIVGIVGSSSSPVSGMTIATLLVTCTLLLYFGVEGVAGMMTAMSVGAIVCIAVCMSGDIAQDLKTGYLLGATPWRQQLMEFVGLLFPALAMGFTIYILNDTFGFVEIEGSSREPLLAPQANVMATVVQGIMNANLPWLPIIVGGMIAIAVELLGISSLPFAIGLYLPLNLSTPIMTGGLISWFIKKFSKKEEYKKKNENGILFASGLVAGDALIGVAVAFMIGIWPWYENFYDNPGGWESMINNSAAAGVGIINEFYDTLSGSFSNPLSLIMFFSLAALLAHLAYRGFKEKK